MNKEEFEKMKQALIEIRRICRDGTLLRDVKILDVYYEASQALDGRAKLLNDMRTGRKK